MTGEHDAEAVGEQAARGSSPDDVALSHVPPGAASQGERPATVAGSAADGGAEGSAGGRPDHGSGADSRTTEVAENDRTSLYRLHGVISRDTARAGGRFVTQTGEAERFWRLVDCAGPGGCWLWTGHRNRDGYGQFKITGAAGRHRTVRAHRWAWQHHHGPVPSGLTLDHLCGRPACVRPDHLEPVTNAENLRRRHARRRQALAADAAPSGTRATAGPVPGPDGSGPGSAGSAGGTLPVAGGMTAVAGPVPAAECGTSGVAGPVPSDGEMRPRRGTAEASE